MRAENGVCEVCGDHGMCLDGLCLKHHKLEQTKESEDLNRELAGNTDVDKAIEAVKNKLTTLCEILLLREQNQSSHERTMIGAAINVLIINVESLREFDK